MARYEKIGGYEIYFDDIYFLAYAGGKRELGARDQKAYESILKLPFALQRNELKKMGFEKNPNVIPIKGIDLLAFIRELKFTPFFDYHFRESHLIQLNDAVIYESIKQRSYDIAMRG